MNNQEKIDFYKSVFADYKISRTSKIAAAKKQSKLNIAEKNKTAKSTAKIMKHSAYGDLISIKENAAISLNKEIELIRDYHLNPIRYLQFEINSLSEKIKKDNPYCVHKQELNPYFCYKQIDFLDYKTGVRQTRDYDYGLIGDKKERVECCIEWMIQTILEQERSGHKKLQDVFLSLTFKGFQNAYSDHFYNTRLYITKIVNKCNFDINRIIANEI